MEFMRDAMFIDSYQNHLLQLTNSDFDVVRDMVKTKYSKWEWNIGNGSNFTIKRKYKNKYYTFTISKGMIVNIEGEYKNVVKSLHKVLLNKRLDYKSLIDSKNISSELIKLIHNLAY
jgi:hypothetical protein